MMVKNQYLKLLVLISIIFFSCKDKDNNGSDLNNEIYSTFQDIYLWYDELPRVSPENFSNPYELVDALRYEPLDRWSFVMTKEEYDQYFVEGEMIGHGFILSSDDNGAVRVALIYPSTTAYDQGVKRGWRVTKVNNVTVNENNVIDLLGESEIGVRNHIEFIDNNGVTVPLDLTKEEISINPVVYSSVIDYNGKSIGYIVFQDFIDAANEEIDRIFNTFNQESIDDLILDFRYNGGGSVDVAIHLAGWLTGNENANRDFINFVHNNKWTELDTSFTVPVNQNSLDIDNIVFIGTRGTASASELMIIGVEPYMDVKLVGTPTDGKPVGMYAIPLRSEAFVLFPISFKYTNAMGEGDFYEGLQPDILVNDDITRDFGDINEAMLNSALNSVTGGVFTKKSTSPSKLIKPDNSLSGFQRAF